MDALTHMLTDPLDPKEENNEEITEECMLGNCRVNLPEDLLEDVSYLVLRDYMLLICSIDHMQMMQSFLPFTFLCNSPKSSSL